MQKTLTKIILSALFLIQAYAFQGFAQAPNQFSYPAVIRDANGLLVENKPVSIKISILSGTANGVAIFQEEHTETTNANGLITIAIGSKVAFNIDWSKGPFFIKTELKKSGEANFVDYGTTQMLSVPYALYAEKSGSSNVPGPAGKDGKDGAVGPIGPKGDTGAVGPQGPAGLPGKDGMNGKDGAVGPIGPKGDTGKVGPQGPEGLPGKDGANGKDGAVGPQGPVGVPGKDGINGKDGVDGKDGVNGINGKDGKDGKVEFQNLRVSETGDTLYLTNGNYIIMPGISAANKTTPKPINYGPSITDADGNTYKTIIIGQQEWMAENLRTTKYSNGAIIPNITDAVTWNKLNYGAWSYYNNEKVNDSLHGKLYNFYAVTNPKNVCPTGWHVPTLNELYILTDEIAKLAPNNVGGSLKSKDKSWINNENATNLIGFNAMPSGYRANYGGFDKLGENFWMHTIDGHNPVHRNLLNAGDRSNTVNPTVLFGYYNYFTPETGASIRCLKGDPAPQSMEGSIQTIDCGGAKINGTLFSKKYAIGISAQISYTGGNEGSYSEQIVSSTGVTGLTASLVAGKFANGSGNLSYTISGIPNASGIAQFTLNIGGKNCTLTCNIEEIKVGSSIGGGVVAYILKAGDPGYVAGETHGIIAAPKDLGKAIYGCYGSVIGTSDSLGKGLANTLAIIKNCKDTSSAAYKCYNYAVNGYDDWYLPSTQEMNLMLANAATIGGFLNETYMGSSEFQTAGPGVYVWKFECCYGTSYGFKTELFNIRPVRSF